MSKSWYNYYYIMAFRYDVKVEFSTKKKFWIFLEFFQERVGVGNHRRFKSCLTN